MYHCEKCNLEFKTYNGFWKHNKNKHTAGQSDSTVNNRYKCDYCVRVYKHKQSKWSHEKTCKILNTKIDFEFLHKELVEVKNELDRVKNKPATIINNKNINKGTINRGPVYNFLTKPGEENINVLTEKEIEFIMDQEMNCLITLVELVNFNENHPENHSFCNTALNDKYISTMNTETLTIEKQRKKDFFDKTLSNGIRNMKLLYDKMGVNAKKTAKANKYKETIDNLIDFVVINNKGKKTYVELMNMLTFNKRHIPQLTWSQLTKNQIPSIKSIDDNSTDSNVANSKLTFLNDDKFLLCTSISESDYSSDSSYDSDTDSIIVDELPTININGKTFILDRNFLYTIENNKKNKLYGTLINGKIKKIKANEIDV